MRELSGSERTDVLGFLARTPLAVEQRYLGAILALTNGHAGAAQAAMRPKRAEAVTGGQGVAIVEIFGAITHRTNCLSEFLGLASVDNIRAQFRAALEDPTIGAIAFVIDSPGGEVSGIADLAAEIRAARGKKPMTAIADEAMYSAAYWLGCAADRVVLTSTAGVGSIGCIAVHVDESGMYEKAGAKITVAKSGKKKAQFNSFEPLSDEARADLQAQVDAIGQMFAKAVAACREGLSAEDITAFEAGTFSGKAAVKAGLADEVTTTEAAIAALQRQLRTPSRTGASAEEEHMSQQATTTGTQDAPPVSSIDAGKVTEIEKAAEKRTLERERIRTKAIHNIFAAASCDVTDQKQRALLTAKEQELIDTDASVEDASAAAAALRASFQAKQSNGTGPAAGVFNAADLPPPPTPRTREEMVNGINAAHAGTTGRLAS